MRTKKVVISKLANLENRENVEYLYRHFGKKVALNYLDKFDKAISLLEKRLYAGKYDEKLKLRRFIILEEINQKRDSILTVSFVFDNLKISPTLLLLITIIYCFDNFCFLNIPLK